MVWTLWRGTQLLGRVHQRVIPDAIHERGNSREVNAVLVPDPICLPLESVMQYVMTLAGTEIVRQHARKPRVSRIRPTADSSSKPAIVAWPVSRQPTPLPPSVPLARQFRIEDDGGRAFHTRSIGLLEFRPHPDHPPSELATLPSGAYIAGSIWLVHFTHDVATPAI